METTSKIYVIELLTFEVNKQGTKRNFLGKKALMAERNKESAEETIKSFTKSENESREKFNDLYHLEFDYIITEITLY